MSGHEQVKASRATVDKGIVGLLEAVWAAGLETQFSCQGGGLPGRPPAPASITFATVDDALRFMRATMERSYWYNRLTMQLAEPIENFGPVRAHVHWPAIDDHTGDSVTAALTNIWAGRQRPDDVFTRARR
ncbi:MULTISPECIES: hypothetical protein [Mycobacterium]|uniref:Uncharacterized protein n=1 Tax=Mycobacterium paragordonae TaxID=1389713 RepID=A0AAJ1SAG3_9MYCO|nr:hypothetical protein [Mycobacterium paragordonae]MDP7739630.1 hypothetical protein [Mycobacterium paragordonae]PJE18009.1 MAG: hypothetical protein CK429_05145 [Mycobacterium sp.]